MTDPEASSAHRHLGLRAFSRPGAGYGLALEWDGSILATNVTPMAIQVFSSHAFVWHRRSYSWITQTTTGLRAGGQVQAANALLSVEDTFTLGEDHVHLSRMVSVRGTARGVGFLSACEWTLVDEPSDALWFIPGV
jgi:hypothetical protein